METRGTWLVATLVVAALAAGAAWLVGDRKRAESDTPRTAQAGSIDGSSPATDGPPLWADDDPPDLSIFAASRMTALFDQGFSAADAAGAMTAADRAELATLDAGFAERPDEGPSPDLLPAVPPSTRMGLIVVPRAVGAIVPLWSKSAWSDDELGSAREAARALTSHGAPEVTFVAGGAEENRAALRAIGVWFRDLVSQDHMLAALIFTLDDGPYVGLEVPDGPADVVGETRLDDQLAVQLLQLREPSRYGAFAFRVTRDGERLWQRLVSTNPMSSLEEVALADTPPDDLGPYGWKVPFFADGEYGHLYIARNGRLRFYFHSW